MIISGPESPKQTDEIMLNPSFTQCIGCSQQWSADTCELMYMKWKLLGWKSRGGINEMIVFIIKGWFFLLKKEMSFQYEIAD